MRRIAKLLLPLFEVLVASFLGTVGGDFASRLMERMERFWPQDDEDQEDSTLSRVRATYERPNEPD